MSFTLKCYRLVVYGLFTLSPPSIGPQTKVAKCGKRTTNTSPGHYLASLVNFTFNLTHACVLCVVKLNINTSLLINVTNTTTHTCNLRHMFMTEGAWPTWSTDMPNTYTHTHTLNRLSLSHNPCVEILLCNTCVNHSCVCMCLWVRAARGCRRCCKVIAHWFRSAKVCVGVGQ